MLFCKSVFVVCISIERIIIFITVHPRITVVIGITFRLNKSIGNHIHFFTMFGTAAVIQVISKIHTCMPIFRKSKIRTTCQPDIMYFLLVTTSLFQQRNRILVIEIFTGILVKFRITCITSPRTSHTCRS